MMVATSAGKAKMIYIQVDSNQLAKRTVIAFECALLAVALGSIGTSKSTRDFVVASPSELQQKRIKATALNNFLRAQSPLSVSLDGHLIPQDGIKSCSSLNSGFCGSPYNNWIK
jgi:hypothetical protein